MTVHVTWGGLLALVCICILAKNAISQGQMCGLLQCGHKVRCRTRRIKNWCKCRNSQDVPETKIINSGRVSYCVEKCRRNDPTCPNNTTCMAEGRVFLCKCLADEVQSSTGQCLVETTTSSASLTTPGVSSTTPGVSSTTPGISSTVTDSTSTTVTATQVLDIDTNTTLPMNGHSGAVNLSDKETGTNSAALTAGLVVGLGGVILLAVIVLVVVVRKRKRKSGDDTGKTLRRPSVERQMTANVAYSNVSLPDSRDQDNAACSTAIVQTGAYEEVDLDRNPTLNNNVDGTAVIVTSKNDGTAWAMQRRHSPQNAEYTSPNEYHILCEMKNANWNECSIQPEMNGNENTKAFQEKEDSVEQNKYIILCDPKNANESESSIQPELYENPKGFQQNVDSAKQNECQVLYDLKATNESKVQPEQNQYQVLFDLKTTDESERRIQPGSQNPKVFQEKVDSTQQNEYHILCDLKTNNDNESSIQPEITASENPEVFQSKENNSAQQNEYHILCDLKPATESENSVQPEMAGNKNPEIFKPYVHESTEQNAYHILYDVKPATENESSVQPEMTGSEYRQAFQQNVDSTAVLITDASPRGRHSPPGVAPESRFGREEGEYDELKLPKV